MKKTHAWNLRVGRVEGGGPPKGIPQPAMLEARNDVSDLVFKKGGVWEMTQKAYERLDEGTLKNHILVPTKKDDIGVRP
jgi:hypothetical protein